VGPGQSRREARASQKKARIDRRCGLGAGQGGLRVAPIFVITSWPMDEKKPLTDKTRAMLERKRLEAERIEAEKVALRASRAASLEKQEQSRAGGKMDLMCPPCGEKRPMISVAESTGGGGAVVSMIMALVTGVVGLLIWPLLLVALLFGLLGVYLFMQTSTAWQCSVCKTKIAKG